MNIPGKTLSAAESSGSVEAKKSRIAAKLEEQIR